MLKFAIIKKSKNQRRHSEGVSPKNPLPGERVKSQTSQKSKFLKIRFFVNFTILLAQKAGDSSVGYASLRMTAITENGMRKTENGICKNSLFCKFEFSTRSPGGGFFAGAQNDGVGL